MGTLYHFYRTVKEIRENMRDNYAQHRLLNAFQKSATAKLGKKVAPLLSWDCKTEKDFSLLKKDRGRIDR
jgi:hypothetical protein